MNDNKIAPDGAHKAVVKNIHNTEFLTTFDVEILGGILDGFIFHLHLDRVNKAKMSFNTIQMIALCGGVKTTCFPYPELIGIKILITVKNKNIKKISCFKDKKTNKK